MNGKKVYSQSKRRGMAIAAAAKQRKYEKRCGPVIEKKLSPEELVAYEAQFKKGG